MFQSGDTSYCYNFFRPACIKIYEHVRQTVTCRDVGEVGHTMH